MKNSVLTLFAAFSILAFSCGQEVEKKEKLSPYAKSIVKINDVKIEVSYNSPQKRGRTLWGELVPYGKVWRTGADEATVFSSNRPIAILNDTLPAGKYSLFTIPTANDWTVIFNTTWDQWGAFNYDAMQDQLRGTVSPMKDTAVVEGMSLSVEELQGNRGQLHFAWGQLQWDLPFEVIPEEEK